MAGRGKGGRPSGRGGRGYKSKVSASVTPRNNVNMTSNTVEPLDEKAQEAVKGSEKTVNSANGSLNAAKVSEKNVSEPQTNRPSQNDSRYKPLENICPHCDVACFEISGLISDNICCESCKKWSHMGCEKTDHAILTDMKKKGAFICEDCKEFNESSSEIERSSSELESSMNSEDRRRAEYDTEMDEDELLRLDDNENINGANYTPELESTVVSKMGAPVLESTTLSNGESVSVLKSTATQDNTQLSNQLVLKRTQSVNSTQQSTHYSQNRGKGQVEQMETEVHERPNMLGEKLSDDKVDINTDPQNVRKSPVEIKLDQLMNMFQEVRDDIYNLDTNVNNLDERNKQFMSNTTTQITRNVQKNMEELINNQNKQIREDNAKNIEEKVKQEMNKNIGLKIDDIFTQRTGPTIDYVVNQRLATLEKNLEGSITRKVEKMMDQKIETELDDFQEMLWRQKNVLIVGLPESKNPIIHERQLDDLDEINRIFNLFVRFDDRDIEGLPVRLGRISEKPRTLRITLKSEVMVRELTRRARESNHLINPTEKDNRKKNI